MNQFEVIYLIIYVIVACFIIYQIILIVCSLFIDKKVSVQNTFLHSFLILIPAYKESKVLLKMTEASQKINYPESKYKTIIIADECDEAVLSQIPAEIKVQKIFPIQHNKVNSLKTILPIEDVFGFVVILDADNIVHPEFLNNLNKEISNDFKVIQGLRIPKNLETTTARLDAITDLIYNQLDRIIPAKLGLTGTLSGSGFAIERNLFQEMINSINTFGGFDKILQSKLLLKNIPVHIAIDAIIYDEKTSLQSEYIKQRKRWLYFHFYNSIKYGFKLLLNGIKNLNINQLHLGIISLRPPLNFLLFLGFILIITGVFINLLLTLFLFVLVSLFVIYLILILKKAGVFSIDLLISLPLIFIRQIISLIGMMEARKDSLRTKK